MTRPMPRLSDRITWWRPTGATIRMSPRCAVTSGLRAVRETHKPWMLPSRADPAGLLSFVCRKVHQSVPQRIAPAGADRLIIRIVTCHTRLGVQLEAVFFVEL